MSAAARQRRRDALIIAATGFANRLADVLDEVAQGDPADDVAVLPVRRRRPQRIPYVPTDGPEISADAVEEAKRRMRRIGVR